MRIATATLEEEAQLSAPVLPTELIEVARSGKDKNSMTVQRANGFVLAWILIFQYFSNAVRVSDSRKGASLIARRMAEHLGKNCLHRSNATY